MPIFNPNDFVILIVDDSPKNIQVLGSILRKEGYSIEFAVNGMDSLDWLGRKKFDMVLLDVMMPDMNGFEVCKKIRSTQKYAELPIIFLTAKADNNSIIEGFEAGGQDYVTKPFQSNELLARVKTHLELKRSKQGLIELNKELEKKVKERTFELNQTNLKLDEANNSLNKMNKELINLDVEKAQFLQIISHEIRTPLNGIKGFIEVLKLKITDKTLQNYFNHIDKSSYRLERFALQALLITELRIKKDKVVKSRYVVKDIISQITNSIYSEQITEKQLNLKFEFEPEHLILWADNKLLLNCLQNVIENAVVYTEKNGNILIKAYTTEDYDCVEVIDDGPGFSELALANIFKMFQPGHIHTDHNIGLDLAVVNLIMQAHDGTIDVHNNANRGATCRLSFPKSKT
jgi:two-component system, sensor histidine kinase and response regulator